MDRTSARGHQTTLPPGYFSRDIILGDDKG